MRLSRTKGLFRDFETFWFDLLDKLTACSNIYTQFTDAIDQNTGFRREQSMDRECAYFKTTRDIEVSVTPVFLVDRSVPEDSFFVWAYNIRIENKGSCTVTLRNRHWRITDADGNTEIVDGEGVVGEQPVLAPGQSYEYSSGTPLSTPSGIMVGSYEMESDDGLMFAVDIPAFSLDSPHESSSFH